MASYSYISIGGMSIGGRATVPAASFVLLTTSDITVSLASVDLRISWTSDLPDGTWYQVYIGTRLAKWTREKVAIIPLSPNRETVWVAAVPEDSASTDFSSRLPTIARRSIRLLWYGGRYLGANIAGFNIYSGSSPGAAIDYTKPIAKVPVYQGRPLDGYGRGGYGRGGFGSAATEYTWESGVVSSGVWNVGVKSVDVYGNEGEASTIACAVNGPPDPPAPFSDGTRLHYTYDNNTHTVTLLWNPSPSA